MTSAITHPLARQSRTLSPGRARRPLRWTRRGRVLMRLLVAMALLCAGSGLGLAVARADEHRGAPPAQTIVVEPGQTLWEIASQLAPGQDPREVIARIRATNRLDSAALSVGQRLTLPR